MTASVVLHETTEFLAELDRDRGELDRDLVRVSTLRYPVMGGAVTRVRIEAGYRVRGEIIRLRMVVGDLWGVAADDKVRSDLRRRMEEIENAVADRALEIRAGMYEEPSS